MNKNAPIGIFDSGLGGLTVFEEIRALLPHEDLVYIADSAFAPYGNKPDTCIQERSLKQAEFLVEQCGVKALVVACNTATAAAISKLRQRFDMPVIGMEPALKPAVEMTKSGIVGILATGNTLKSDKFSSLLDIHQHRARILTQPCHGLVEAIEAGNFATFETKELLFRYLKPLLDAGVDTVVLGCTHYPWLTTLIRSIAGEHIQLVSTGSAVAKHLQHQLISNDGVTASDKKGYEQFWTSGDVHRVAAVAQALLNKKIDLKLLPT
ncbi:MAG: glutamate racemase [Ghiorsea sp.]